jgi:hypothetical protein
MKVEFSGSTVELRGLAKRLRGASSSQTLREFADNVGEEVIDLIAQGFELEVDPYGEAWKKPKVIDDGRQLLVGKTANLRRRWHAISINPDEIRIGPSADSTEYAKYHQTGTGIYGRGTPIVLINARMLHWSDGILDEEGDGILDEEGGGILDEEGGGKKGFFARSVRGAPARKMFPDGPELPPAWRKQLEEMASEFWTAYFTGA